jgi:tRNA(adenine34) deaminase
VITARQAGFKVTNNKEMKIDLTRYMKIALAEAEKAGRKAEVPIGAVLVAENGEILAATHNQTVSLHDPTAHAEILALRQAAEKTQNYRLLNTTLYVTIEPCVMCMGAIVHARISTLVFGARDPKWGGAGSLYNLAADNRLNHKVQIVEGVCEDECRSLMQEFFHLKRL